MLAARIRAFEKRLQEHMHEITVPVHLSLGHEQVAVEIAEHFRKGDWWFSTHRNHHHYIAAGGSEQKLWDEIMGLESGVNGGFSGSQAISDPSINFHSSAIVGGLVGVAVGTAYAIKGSGSMVVCSTGDAGTEAGVFWESLNFAALYELPIAFIVENNGMSVDSPIRDRQATPISTRAEAFGIDVFDDVDGAMKMARAGIPSLCERKVTLLCDHINMGRLPPSKVI
jgi:TPP-dependent pyruvate/acetoin dehydrogenase alpha subunit